jgi:hypothetical protein
MAFKRSFADPVPVHTGQNAMPKRGSRRLPAPLVLSAQTQSLSATRCWSASIFLSQPTAARHIFGGFLLIFGLPGDTWLRLAVWLVVGLVFISSMAVTTATWRSTKIAQWRGSDSDLAWRFLFSNFFDPMDQSE